MNQDGFNRIPWLPWIIEDAPETLFNCKFQKFVLASLVDIAHVFATQIEITIYEIILAKLIVDVEGALVSSRENNIINAFLWV